MFFNTDKNYESEHLKGYFLGLFSPYENLSKTKRKVSEMKKSISNLKRYKAFMDGFLAGVEARRKARLSELEQTRKSPNREMSRER